MVPSSQPPIEHINIIQTIRVIRKALQALISLGLGWPRPILDVLEKKYTSYISGVAPFLLDYFRQNAEYKSYIYRTCIQNTINTSLEKIYSHINSADLGEAKVKLTLECEIHIETIAQTNQSTICQCGNLVEAEICEKCGMVYGNEVVRDSADSTSSNSKHYPSTHFNIWIGYIQAYTTPDIPEKVVEKLRVSILKSGIDIEHLRCPQVRQHLQRIDASTYYNIVPYLRKLLNGFCPPQLTSDELDDLRKKFNDIVHRLKNLLPDDNIKYYPYIIYKILGSTLKNGKRKSQILECIHLQSDTTMKKSDIVFEKISSGIIRFTPTNRHEFTDYI